MLANIFYSVELFQKAFSVLHDKFHAFLNGYILGEFFAKRLMILAQFSWFGALPMYFFSFLTALNTQFEALRGVVANFVNIISREVCKIVKLYTNYTNEICIEKELINENIYFFTEKFLGIPMYVSTDKYCISFVDIVDYLYYIHNIIGMAFIFFINKISLF